MSSARQVAPAHRFQEVVVNMMEGDSMRGEWQERRWRRCCLQQEIVHRRQAMACEVAAAGRRGMDAQPTIPTCAGGKEDSMT